MKLQSLARTVLAFAAFTIPAIAQITGDLVVRVIDPSDAVVSGAKVTIKSVAQGSTRDLQSDGQGIARFSLLSIGDYEIRVESAGFASPPASLPPVSSTELKNAES